MRELVITLPEGFDPAIGPWVWELEEERARLKRAVADLTQEQLDHPPAGGNSIGSLLYHIAAIELSWLYDEVLVAPYPDELTALFHADVRGEGNQLSQVTGQPVRQHLHRLDAVREQLLASYRSMDLADYRCPRSLPDYQVTPEWVLFHLLRHEAQHLGQILLLRKGLGLPNRGLSI
ncbi:MAG: DinB family protein [Bacillota bacterium]